VVFNPKRGVAAIIEHLAKYKSIGYRGDKIE